MWVRGGIADRPLIEPNFRSELSVLGPSVSAQGDAWEAEEQVRQAAGELSSVVRDQRGESKAVSI